MIAYAFFAFRDSDVAIIYFAIIDFTPFFCIRGWIVVLLLTLLMPQTLLKTLVVGAAIEHRLCKENNHKGSAGQWDHRLTPLT